MVAERFVIAFCLALCAAPSQAESAITLGRWLIDNTNSRLLLPYKVTHGQEDVWTNGLEVVFEGHGAPSPGTPSTTTTTTTTSTTLPFTTTVSQPQEAQLTAAELSPVQASGKKPKMDLELAQWYSVGYDALSHEAAGSQKRLVKLLTIWMEHESDFETRRQISKQLDELEDVTSFLQVSRSSRRMQTINDDVDPVTMRQLKALEKAHAFVGATAQTARAPDGSEAEHISIPQVVGDFVPDASNMVATQLNGNNWVAVLPLKTGQVSGKSPWRRVSAQGAQAALAPVQSEPKHEKFVPAPASQPAAPTPVAKASPPLPQAQAQPSTSGSSYMNELSGALDGDDVAPVAPAPRPQPRSALRAVSRPSTSAAPMVDQVFGDSAQPQQPQPEAPHRAAMVDAAGPDEDASSHQARFAESMPEMPVGKAKWLNWHPNDDTKQVSGMLQQLGMLKGSGARKADDPNTPAFAKDDIDNDESSSSSAPSAPSPPSRRVVAWASLVPGNLRRNAPFTTDTDAVEPGKPAAAVAAHIDFPVMPTAPMTQQAVAMPQMSVGGGGGDQMELLKQMNPASYNIVKDLLAKKAAGMTIPGLTQHEKPAEDPAIAALGQVSVGSAGSDSSSSASTAAASSVSSGYSSSAAASDSSATSSYGSSSASSFGSSGTSYNSGASSFGGSASNTIGNSDSSSSSSYGSSATSSSSGASSYGSSASSDSASVNAMSSLDASTNAIMSADSGGSAADTSSDSSDDNSYGGSHYGGSSYGGSSFSRIAPPSKITNYKPPAPTGDATAVNGLLAEVMRLTGKHVGGVAKKQDDASSNQPAFLHDFDDSSWGSADSSTDGGSAPRASRGWGDLIPGHHHDQDQDSQLQETAAAPNPPANPYASLLN